jgi:hypothetical protein
LTELIADLLLGERKRGRGRGRGQGEERTKGTERRGKERRGQEKEDKNRQNLPPHRITSCVLYCLHQPLNVAITGRGTPVSAGCYCTVKRISNLPESHSALLSSPPLLLVSCSLEKTLLR